VAATDKFEKGSGDEQQHLTGGVVVEEKPGRNEVRLSMGKQGAEGQ